MLLVIVVVIIFVLVYYHRLTVAPLSGGLAIFKVVDGTSAPELLWSQMLRSHRNEQEFMRGVFTKENKIDFISDLSIARLYLTTGRDKTISAQGRAAMTLQLDDEGDKNDDLLPGIPVLIKTSDRKKYYLVKTPREITSVSELKTAAQV